MRRRSERGFTLVEVLVAFAILAVAFGSVFQALSSGLAQQRIAEAATLRVLEARSLLDRVGADLPLAEGVREGRLASGEVWRLAVLRLAPPDEGAEEPLGAYRVALTLTGADGRALTLETIRLGP